MPLPRRKSRNLKVNKTFIIVCEGIGTEVNYFTFLKQKFRKPNIKVEINGVGKSKHELLHCALGKRKTCGRDVAATWVVFDKDDLSNRDIEETHSLAKKNNIKVAFTNECFEVWLLMHIEEVTHDTALPRRRIYKKLETYFGIDNYEKNKNNRQIIEKLVQKIDIALENNSKLSGAQTDILKNPYSSINVLVNELMNN